MPRRKRDQEIIVLEQDGERGLKWLLVGGLLGAGIALLLAPASGEETREELVRKARRLRLSAEDAIDELQERFDSFAAGDVEDDEDDEDDEDEVDEDLDDEVEEGEGDEEEDASEESTDELPKRPRARPRRKIARKKKSDISEAREELERRVEDARARRRASVAEDEEPDA